MIQFYFNSGPNPMKVALFLEESGLPYEAHPVDMLKGDQFKPSYLAINPNAKAPAIVDDGVTVFDSNAILLYLAEKTGLFLPPQKSRADMLSWLMFIATGVGPYSGQAVHFKHFAPEQLPYAVNRYQREVERHYDVLNAHLETRKFMLGETYTLVDMALWGWARMVPFVLGEEAFVAMPNVKRVFDDISARPAAKAALELPKTHTFKREMDDEARANMFPQNRPRAA